MIVAKIVLAHAQKKTKTCFFCRSLDEKFFLLFASQTTFVIFSIYKLHNFKFKIDAVEDQGASNAKQSEKQPKVECNHHCHLMEISIRNYFYRPFVILKVYGTYI